MSPLINTDVLGAEHVKKMDFQQINTDFVEPELGLFYLWKKRKGLGDREKE